MAESTTPAGWHIDVRYSKFYVIIVILLSLVFLALAADDIISLKQEIFQGTNFLIPFLYLVAGSLFFLSGITLRKRRYLRLDRENKTFMVFGTIGSWSRKYPYDSIHFASGRIHLEKSGKKKELGFMKFTCDKDDLQAFIKALSVPE